MAKYEIPEGSLVLTQPAVFYAPRRQFEAVAVDGEGVKHNGFGDSPSAAYTALKKSLHEAGQKGEIIPKKRAGNSGQALVEGAAAYNELNKPVKRAEQEAAKVGEGK